MKRIKLSSGHICIVDDDDYQLLSRHKWQYLDCRTTRIGYAFTIILKKHILIHRMIMGTFHGSRCIDHINRNGLDNRKENLRIVKRPYNIQNSSKAKNKSSKYKGVYRRNGSSIWTAYISLKKRHYYLGGFSKEIEAAMAYDKKAKEFYGKDCFTNEKDIGF